ncbi:MAG: FAD synthase [Candidatus Bathyarchaeota archaeon]|nr:FAD synthase [Candidatus Bathyarchaeota archaeon]
MDKKGRKQKIVLASGVFDLLHLGHVKFLEAAKKAGGKYSKLIVIVARDRTIEKIKGRKPIIPENQRCALINSLKVVDEAILGYETLDIEEVIKKIKPELIVLGHDQKVMKKSVQDYVENNNVNIKVIKIRKFGEDALDSSSKILQKIIEEFSR